MGVVEGVGANANGYGAGLIASRGSDGEISELAKRRGARVHVVATAEHRGTIGTVEAARPLVASLAKEAAGAKREPMPMSGIVLGLECGGSDALSGITANPALGVASDLLIAEGCTSILAETPELIGAEHL